VLSFIYSLGAVLVDLFYFDVSLHWTQQWAWPPSRWQRISGDGIAVAWLRRYAARI
jgi:hypothetical protein